MQGFFEVLEQVRLLICSCFLPNFNDTSFINGNRQVFSEMNISTHAKTVEVLTIMVESFISFLIFAGVKIKDLG